ncbi:MAG TPA: beta-N-acetylhexosaminidase [Candidatus Binatia bacterium]|nr:beta-N-acetylhexosaminidase [Candidatus Binatia bacterium]
MDTLRQKIGQLILIGCQGETLGNDERLLIEEYQFSGLILFKKNCTAAAQMGSLCRSIWQLFDAVPPFIAIDQEGGRVQRLSAPFSQFPAAADIGSRNDLDLAYRLGHATAAELSLTGINLDFAPVLDVCSNPNSPIIGDRAFGAEPQRVIEVATAWTRGLRDGGVIPCAKHFPGHGDTDKDSHLELPLVRKSLDELQRIELPPFAHACRNRIEALMTAHVAYPALDPTLPATLSETIVTGLLRHQLGYDGVVFSDDLGMRAISDRYEAEQASTLAVRAGVDVLLFCHVIDKAIAAFEFLCAEAERDPAVRANIETSYRRVTELKRRYLHCFTGVAENQIANRLEQLNHRKLLDGFV